MPHGKRQKSGDSPLSSLASAVASEETLAALAGAGLFAFRGSEAEALALLAIRGDDNPAEFAPRCFRAAFDPTAELCGGCVFAASCWLGDNTYLAALAAGTVHKPPYVPDEVVSDVLARRDARPAPPTPRRRK